MPALADLVDSDDQRQEHIVAVLVDAFSDLIEADPVAFRRKFRKMAADPFAFYRGSAPLFYADVADFEDPWVDDDTSRVWIQGDLHAENYGTYMDAEGVLVFDVNDFDEAYLGHYTWDLQRMAASLALVGFAKALSDRTIRRLIEAYATSYADMVRTFATTSGDRDFRLTLDNTDGPLHDVLETARLETRVHLLERNTTVSRGDRRFVIGPGVRQLEDDERAAVCAAYERYLDTIPEVKRQQSISYAVKDAVGRTGFGIGSAGLRAYNLLVEGRSQALENDVVLAMKQAQVPAPSRVVQDERIRGYFAQRFPSARCRHTPTRGSAGASSTASARSSRSSRPTRPTSTGARSPSPTRCCRCSAISGEPLRRSTASPTSAAIIRSSTSRWRPGSPTSSATASRRSRRTSPTSARSTALSRARTTAASSTPSATA
jgi:hypothetical protein